jgi:hypothetical protein
MPLSGSAISAAYICDMRLYTQLNLVLSVGYITYLLGCFICSSVQLVSLTIMRILHNVTDTIRFLIWLDFLVILGHGKRNSWKQYVLMSREEVASQVQLNV